MTNFQDQVKILSTKMLKIEKLWELAKFKPNDEQKEAILHVDGPLYLTAGPGSGKTRVLLWRTVNLMVFHGIKPKEIFLSTFTEKAALQLKQGLQSLLAYVTNINGQPYDLSQMYIGTVHSLCQKILADRRHFITNRQRNRPPQLLDELGQYFHIAKNRTWQSILTQAGLTEEPHLTINTIWGSPSQSKHKAIINCSSIFDRFSEECIDPQEALNRLGSASKKFTKEFTDQGFTLEQVNLLLRLYSGYRESLNTNPNARLTDFSLLQQEAFRVLEQFSGSDNVFKHVIVDEYQDTNTIQERIFFKLAGGAKNFCVVGDDDQALYRFRGATVENFVEFPNRCKQYLDINPKRISLDTNYRSREPVVNFYTEFIRQIDWKKENGDGYYRVVDKNVHAKRNDSKPAVVASAPAKPELACAEVAQLVKKLIDDGKVENANQIAFLFPSMKSNGNMAASVKNMKDALEKAGLQVYAPRAGRFLEVDESFVIFGLIIKILGRPSGFEFRGNDYQNFMDWVGNAESTADELIANDPRLKKFVKDRKAELDQAKEDYEILLKVVEKNRWILEAPYEPDRMSRILHGSSGLSELVKKQISSVYFDKLAKDRIRSGTPLSVLYVLKRFTSIDWNLLDLFYKLCTFEHLKKMFDVAEKNGDEGPVANLGLITQYLSRFVNDRVPLITADLLIEKVLQVIFFAYLFALYRLGETELENAEDPFPKGRIPFLTIHQSKGLEFPVVVLGNTYKMDRGPNMLEKITRPLLSRGQGEPLEKMSKFDIMRMFYVALSRAKNLLIIAHYKGVGQRMNEEFKALLTPDFPRIPDLDISQIPAVQLKDEALPKAYSFTADYLMYKKCPRQYMIFRKFDFVPSRSQTMFFGNLVHRTLEDLHHELIRRRTQS